ncbi:hypothetical protein AAX09_03330 [Moraxella bovoculi]|uniref:hypothetical protein n=1 Tax=Moraxella bovoculi TaxID=386891 RepID=UPI000624B04A|nr:hypothetical protein [Moraxella bovoculi]AKG15154.2 hypothetical protein AAX08_03365 [Moraxella bovoculi]AKG18579.1 hypothetical protein AAX09_03330 [Moraxella bovoculi]NSM09894.1 hypothetical protein [Moraxella bovoculi]
MNNIKGNLVKYKWSIIAFTAIFVSVSASVVAMTPSHKNLKSASETLELCQNIAAAFNNDKMDFKPVAPIVEPYWRFGKDQLDLMQKQSELSAKQGLEIWGKPLNTIHIDSDKAGKGYFLRHRFLMRREHTGLLFQCFFYKTDKDDWQFHTINWNDQPYLFFDNRNTN